MEQDVWELYNLPPEPMAEAEVWRAASRLVARYGHKGAAVAKEREDRAIERGEISDFRWWRLVGEAIAGFHHTGGSHRAN